MQIKRSAKLAFVALFSFGFTGFLLTHEEGIKISHAVSGGPDPARTGAPGELT